MKIVFSDLDGTLLDKATYSYERSSDSVKLLRRRGIPLLLCSSKTMAEMETLRRELGVADPFIVENGSAIVVPKGYFPFDVGEERDGAFTVELAPRVEAFERRLRALLASAKVKYTTFAEMTADEVSRDSGLAPDHAEEARRREYTMALKFPTEEERQAGRRAIASGGLTCFSGGKYLTVGDGGSKGKAVRELLGFFTRAFGPVVSYALGDGENDVSMLREVDVPFLVQSSRGCWTEVDLKTVRRIPSVGPDGFAKGVADIVGSSEG